MSDLLRKPGASQPVPHVDPPRAQDPSFADVVPHQARLVSLYDQATFSEGPVWWSARGILVWSDVEGRRVLGWHPDGSVRVVVDATPFINGHTVDTGGNLVHCEHGTRRLARTTPEGGYEGIVETFEGSRFNSPNDVTCAADGALWFTDPSFGLGLPKQGVLAEPELSHRSVYRFDPATGGLDRKADFEQPNGIGFAPDGRTLYVSESSRALDGDKHEIVAFDVGDDHALSNRRIFAVIEPGIPDGLRVDNRGWIWVATGAGVQVLSPDGHRLGLVPTPQVASNLCFGPDEHHLFITSQHHLYRLDLIAA